MGTLTISVGGDNSAAARMYAFRNVALSSFTEGGGFDSGSGSTIYDRAVTTAGGLRLAVSFIFVSDDNALDAFNGENGGNWVETVNEFRHIMDRVREMIFV